MSTEISIIVKLKLAEPLTEKSRGILDKLTSHVESTEPGTLVYEWFLDDDQTMVCVLERYSDSAAIITHSQAMSPEQREKMAKIGTIESMLVLGTPDEQLASMLKKAGATIMAPLTGFYR
ncbi:antibiotic biosynthesis monooxygenase [Kordiimonas aquimaris]|uniref:antibiotic biosynthesis monooxygenase n=1 Tax=Kordiimonas aquimaris TaxID=707591 RepID=UPI0021D2E43D|nr:antibiotic biosynthesis monooxygenase [Kordiimonas aquimaris]